MDNIDQTLVAVRADTSGFARDVADMRGALDGPFADAAERAGRTLETSLARAIASGKLGFEDLKGVALRVMDDIAASAFKAGIGAILHGSNAGGSASGSGGLLTLGASVMGALGLPGRATGGPVAPGQAYLVGERGPEVFVPTTSGGIAANGGARPRDVRVSITVSAPAAAAPAMLARSTAQVARAVKAALMDVED